MLDIEAAERNGITTSNSSAPTRQIATYRKEHRCAGGRSAAQRLDDLMLETMLRSRITKIIYVSCNPPRSPEPAVLSERYGRQIVPSICSRTPRTWKRSSSWSAGRAEDN
ncbi:MAG: hypothetical protein ACLTCB_07380 [Merdibacter sp.]